jgi:hypothetical protein
MKSKSSFTKTKYRLFNIREEKIRKKNQNKIINYGIVLKNNAF